MTNDGCNGYKPAKAVRMPVSLSINREQRLVYSAFLGTITEEDFQGQPARILAQPHFDPTFSDILDFSSATEMQVSDETLVRMAEQKSIFRPEAIHVVIAPRGLIRKMAKQFQRLSLESRPNFVIVENRTQAFEYLRQQQKSSSAF